MKHPILLIGILSLAAFFGRTMDVHGQSDIRIGITGGPNASQIKTSTNLMDLLWKYNAGFAFAKPLPGNFSLASELVYIRQGGSLEADRSGKYITQFDYISLPVLVRFRPGGKDVFVQAGGKFSYLINSERIHIGNYNTSTLDDLNHLRQWDAGAIGGVGYWLGNHVVIDARYYYGMAPLIKKHTVLDPITLEPIFYGADKLYNRVWSLNLTFYL